MQEQFRETLALKEALKHFIEATEELNRSYTALKEEVKRLSEELSQQKNLLKAIIESINDGVIAINREETVIASNQKAKELFGIEDGKKIHTFLPNLEGELEFYTIDGERKVVKVSNFPLKQDGKEIGKVVVLRDITRERELEEENKRKERLSAMGEMAVTIAHEIRNPLGSIELFAGLIRKEGDPEVKRWAESITKVVKSINNLISNMLIFTRPLHVEKELLELKEVVEECAEAATHALREKGIELEIKGKAIRAWADRELLKQAILNLLINAIQAIEDRGSITVEVGERENEAFISVTDTGCGIPKEVQKKVFDPFFSTKKRGTGLGLAIVHRIVEAHHGRITLSSVPGRTTFTIYLPKDGEDSPRHSP